MDNKSFYFLNLGCPKNQADGDQVRGTLIGLGLAECEIPDGADYIIVNTCAFIEQARMEVKGEIAELLPAKKNGTRLIAIGCYPMLADIRKELPELDAAFGLNQLREFYEFIAGPANDRTTLRRSPRIINDLPYAYIKIADGCDNRCSYCTIPRIRGPYAERSPRDIRNEVEYLASGGIKEIVLVAQDTVLYGRGAGSGLNLAMLAKMLSEVDGIEWIRILYAHPAHLNEEFIDRLFENDKVCRYLDIPIQHISRKILTSMRRHSDPDEIKKLINYLRSVDETISLRTTFMVGFPGETDEDFGELLDFIEEAEFDYAGVFRYSPESGTDAVKFVGAVDPDLAGERYEMLYETIDRISCRRARARVGKRENLLVERSGPDGTGIYEARSYRQAPEIDGYYLITSKTRVRAGDFVECIITDLNDARPCS